MSEECEKACDLVHLPDDRRDGHDGDDDLIQPGFHGGGEVSNYAPTQW
jgi:hypothetical protein